MRLCKEPQHELFACVVSAMMDCKVSVTYGTLQSMYSHLQTQSRLEALLFVFHPELCS